MFTLKAPLVIPLLTSKSAMIFEVYEPYRQPIPSPSNSFNLYALGSNNLTNNYN